MREKFACSYHLTLALGFIWKEEGLKEKMRNLPTKTPQ